MIDDPNEEVVYTIRFDGRSKVVLMDLIKREMQDSEQKIMDGDMSTDERIRHGELLALYKGLLYSEPKVIR